MTNEACEEMRLLIQAEIDGELDAARTAMLQAHAADCLGCTETRKRLAALSVDLRRAMPYHAAPAALREAIAQRIAVPAPAVRRTPTRLSWAAGLVRRWRELTAFGGGAALAAGLAVAILLPNAAEVSQSVVSDHVRALQPGHLMDVISTDQHTVKPWFNGRLDFSPPVKDLVSEGFPLAGGRLDYIDGHPAAALVYHRAKHVIDLLIWPDHGGRAVGAGQGERDGYNFIHWSDGGMTFWAVSDLNAQELADFVRLWRSAT